MDDVLDNHCKITAPKGYDNYEGPWKHDEYYDVVNARCGKHDCELEKCYKIEKQEGYFNSPDTYNYVSFASNMVWNVSDDVTTAGSNDTTIEALCVSKHNPASNIYCEPNLIPHCRNMFNDEVYYYDSNDSAWKTTYINRFMNSDGECEWRNTNRPYELVNYKSMKDKTFMVENPNATLTVYDERGPRCLLNSYDNFNYFDDKGNEFQLLQDKFKEFDNQTNSFVCLNGTKKKYGYSNVANGVPGFTCGWEDDTTCEECKPGKSHCYEFNANTREYSQKNFMKVVFDHDDNQASDSLCDEYLVKDSQLSTYTTYTAREISEDPRMIDSLIHINDTVGASSYTTTKDDTTQCVDTIPNDCSPQATVCHVMGSSLNADAKSVYMNQNVQLGSSVPFDNQVVQVEYNRRWAQDGTSCEYCMVDSSKECIPTTLSTSLPTCLTKDQVTCPAGLKTVEIGFSKFCDYCDVSEYYDAATTTCKPLIGCDAGQYFNPFTNISDTFKLYNNETNTEITDNTNNSVVSKSTFDNKKFSYLQNNTTTQCTRCDGVNEYMDADDGHTNFECSTCRLQNDITQIMTTDVNKTSCTACVQADVEQVNPNPKYVVIDSDMERTCETCPSLSPDDLHKEISSIAAMSHSDRTGKCYRKCVKNRRFDNMILVGGNKDYNGGSPAGYELCDYTCDANYQHTENGCEICPVGTDNTINGNTCTPCAIGTYNHRPGEACKPCPSPGISDVMHGQNVSTLNDGSTSKNDCTIQCKGSSSQTAAYENNRYVLGSCPDEVCTIAGKYTKSAFDGKDMDRGYTLSPVTGTKNSSMDPNNCHTTEQNVVDGCDSGYQPFVSGNKNACCKSGLDYNASTNTCDCKDMSYYRSINAFGINTQHVETVSYNIAHKQCLPDTCKGDLALDNTSGIPSCVLSCSDTEYKTESTSSCTLCPVVTNALTMRTIGDKNSESDCVVQECNVGYHISPNNRSCIESTSPCDSYELITNPHVFDFMSHDAINPSTSSIKNGSLPKYYEKISTETTDCPDTDPESSCPFNSRIPVNNSREEIYNCCDTVDHTYHSTRSYSEINTNGEIINATVSGSSPSKSACCPVATELKVSKVPTTGQEFYGCCTVDKKLYVLNDETHCCPTPETAQNGKQYFVDENSTCSFTCKPGYYKDGSECSMMTTCPETVQEIMRISDGAAYSVNEKGAHIIYNSNVENTTLSGGTCPTDNSDIATYINTPSRCINFAQTGYTHDDTYAKECCADDTAIFDSDLDKCTIACVGNYFEWTKDGNIGDDTITYTKTPITGTRVAYANGQYSCPDEDLSGEVIPPESIDDYLRTETTDVVMFQKTIQLTCYQKNTMVNTGTQNTDYYDKKVIDVVDGNCGGDGDDGWTDDIASICNEDNLHDIGQVGVQGHPLVACCLVSDAIFDPVIDPYKCVDPVIECSNTWSSTTTGSLTTHTLSTDCPGGSSPTISTSGTCTAPSGNSPVYCCPDGKEPTPDDNSDPTTYTCVDPPTCVDKWSTSRGDNGLMIYSKISPCQIDSSTGILEADIPDTCSNKTDNKFYCCPDNGTILIPDNSNDPTKYTCEYPVCEDYYTLYTSENIYTYTKSDNLTDGTCPEGHSLPNNNMDCSPRDQSIVYCCTDVDHQISLNNDTYTCGVPEYEWSTKIKPMRYQGYDEDTTLYHLIDSVLNDKLIL
jgi:hypothetical protein